MRKMLATLGMVAVAAGLLLAGCSGSGPSSKKPESAPVPSSGHSSSPASLALTTRPVPPYHESADTAKPFPQLLPASYFRDYPLVARAYKIAGEIPAVIAQQPCYCHCHKVGHRSLLDCYASDHGAG